MEQTQTKKKNVFLAGLKGKGLPLVLAVVMCAVLFAVFFSGGTGKTTTETQSLEGYTLAMESKLEKLLGTVDGAGKVRVMITFEESATKLYAYETKTVTSGGVTTVTKQLVTASGKPVTEGERVPRVLGVVVCLEGANQLRVRMDVVAAVQTLLDVPAERIEVLLAG